MLQRLGWLGVSWSDNRCHFWLVRQVLHDFTYVAIIGSLHTLALQYKTASASETVIGTFSFLQFRGKSQTCMAGDRGLHDVVF